MTSLLRSFLCLLAPGFQWVTPLSFSWPSSILLPPCPCYSFTTHDNSQSAFFFSLWNGVSFFTSVYAHLGMCMHAYVRVCTYVLQCIMEVREQPRGLAHTFHIVWDTMPACCWLGDPHTCRDSLVAASHLALGFWNCAMVPCFMCVLGIEPQVFTLTHLPS